ncbi:MAG TPA: hypothetical protein VG890_10405, partial [Puia sp.]|nr:hypothetical protein [Puia sp.]
QFPAAVGSISLDDVLTSLDQTKQENQLAQNISTKAPKVIFTTAPSMLVLIDGEPKLQHNTDWNLDVVMNTPFTIIKNNDGQFYLYGAKHWYVAPSATGPYQYTNGQVPSNLSNIEQELIAKAQAANSNKNNNQNAGNNQGSDQTNPVSNIIVSTVPAELIQSTGEPNFTPVQGTNLLFMSNSNNDIFMDENSQQYFVLISGRWYQTKNLKSDNWTFVPADHLPADFAKIPPGSQKDNVLSSVAGTDEARDAVMDAEIPQTAKVDRNTATTQVNYDGRPKFTDIDGTNLQYAVNTSSTVIRTPNGRFYTVDNGVWFVSDDAQGPWSVATDRPDEIDRVPPDNPVYNSKYVYVYDVTPDYVYMGYTPGYLNSFIFGPTVVYGTGFYYNPWFGGYYYPRPWSWGFNFCYTPWYGWSFGWGYSYGWFGFGFGYWGGYHPYGCGWWGPSCYHPAYWGGWHGGPRPYGFYGNSFAVRNSVRINHANNIYINRGGVATRSVARSNNFRNVAGRPQTMNSNRPSGSYNNTRPNNAAGARPGGYNNAPNSRPSNLYSDRQGNVYQRDQTGQWQQRQNRTWAPVNNQQNQAIQNLNRQRQMQSRGEVRTQNFQRVAPQSYNSGGYRPAPSGGSSFRPSGGGGGSRPSGGGGGGGSRSGGGGGGGRRH